MLNVIPTGRMKGVINTSKDTSMKNCMIKCMENVACVSMNYHRGNRACELVGVGYDHDRMVDIHQGWIHYGTPPRSKRSVMYSF